MQLSSWRVGHRFKKLSGLLMQPALGTLLSCTNIAPFRLKCKFVRISALPNGRSIPSRSGFERPRAHGGRCNISARCYWTSMLCLILTSSRCDDDMRSSWPRTLSESLPNRHVHSLRQDRVHETRKENSDTKPLKG